jgi:hypothetical protein
MREENQIPNDGEPQIDDLEQALDKGKNKDQMLLRVTRPDGSLFVVLQMK